MNMKNLKIAKRILVVYLIATLGLLFWGYSVQKSKVAQQVLYVTPALTILGIAASVAMRRCGYGKRSLFIQFMGPILFAIELLIVPL